MDPEESSEKQVVIIGAGPAGLTAARELQGHGIRSTVLESDAQVGGISRTVERDGWRFDIGGHRFFTKVDRVRDFWHEVLPPEDFLIRPRMSRIFYEGRFFDYPLRAVNALRNLGPVEAGRCIGSYCYVKVRPPANQETFEGWVAARFGWRLYNSFFKTYTEKVWGVPATEMPADWAAQRIRNLSMGRAVVNSLLPTGRGSTDVTSLIEEFEYPRLGPGMMWEACADQLQAEGSRVHLGRRVVSVGRDDGRVAVRCDDGSGYVADELVSSMPLGALVEALDPPPPTEVLAAARSLRHRDFLTVALVVPAGEAFPDNWIYVHDPGVQVGRVQNYGSWSPFMVKDGMTCLGLEYFVNEGEELWEMDDDDLIRLASAELDRLGLVEREHVGHGYVVRMPRAYPVYQPGYDVAVATIRGYLKERWPEVHPVGRNGMHRYNNQDHSMMTAMVTADRIATGEGGDPWRVNVEAEYHEEQAGAASGPSEGTGRAAPVTGP
jgi:protoporphyrinogen oxidase